MTKDELIKNQFPNDEFLQSAVSQIVDKCTAELEETNERIASKCYELQETLKKVRVALIQERVANIMNYGNGGVEMFDDLLKMTERECD